MSEKTTLIVKCIDFYINKITDNQSVCPSIDEMREIVKLEDIKESLNTPKSDK